MTTTETKKPSERISALFRHLAKMKDEHKAVSWEYGCDVLDFCQEFGNTIADTAEQNASLVSALEEARKALDDELDGLAIVGDRLTHGSPERNTLEQAFTGLRAAHDRIAAVLSQIGVSTND